MPDESMLLVEGNEDMHVFVHLFQEHRLPLKHLDGTGSDDAVTLRSVNGIENLLDDISVRLKGGGSGDLRRLGIVVDADLDITNRWKEVTNRLISSGYERSVIPDIPESSGTIIAQSNKPLVGIWIMPNNKLPGILEDFIEFLIQERDPLWTAAKECVEHIPKKLRRFGHHIKKAQIHTWLAWQKEPGTPMGQALTKRYMDPFAPHARELVEWIKRLFLSLPSA